MGILEMAPKIINSQFFETPALPTTDCTGKTIIVTGANTGLGKEAVRHFVQLNAAKVIIACRTVSKGEAAKADIEATTKKTGVVEVWPLDYQSYDSIHEFVKRAKALERLDIMLENAGVQLTEKKMVNGYETDIAVNVISTFLLAFLILPKLQESAKKFNYTPTLTIVASDVHYVASFPERKSDDIFAALNKNWPGGMERYCTSKLIEVFAVREIAKRAPLDKLNVIINCLTPGYCISELGRDSEGKGVQFFKKFVARTTEVGSRTLVDAATKGPQSHGKFLMDCKDTKCASIVVGKGGPELQTRVYDALKVELEKIQPGVTAVV